MEQRYQVLPPLSPEEYAALKADIAARGVLVPVEYDEEGQILDGFHRVQICQEVGRDWPRAVSQGLTEDQKLERALQLNLARRHLSKEHKQQLAIRLRQQGWTQARIADTLLISQGTVSMWLNEFINSDELTGSQRIHGKDGKRYPGRKTRHPSRQHPHEPETAEGNFDTAGIAPQKPAQFELLSNTEVPAPASSLTDGQPSTDTATSAAVPRSPKAKNAPFDASSEYAPTTGDAAPRSQPLAPQPELPNVLRLMGELCIALRRLHVTAPSTAHREWSLGLTHKCIQTSAELIDQLHTLQRTLQHHCPDVDTGELINPAVLQMPSAHAGSGVFSVSQGEAEQVFLEPAVGSAPDGQERAGQHAVWERVTALEIEGLDDTQIAVRLNAEEGGRRWNRGAIRALRRAYA
jgi:ParB-like nuclease domain